MELVWFIIILMVGGIIAWVTGIFSRFLSRLVSLFTLITNLIIGIGLWVGMDHGEQWIRRVKMNWIPQLGIHFQLALDGMGLMMVLLTFFLGIVALVVSWKEIEHKTGFFHFNLLWVLAGITGVFVAMDLFLFYFFWEVMLIPMYFIIGIWGHENRKYAAYRFFIFTQAGGLLMFISIILLYVLTGSATGTYSFDFFRIQEIFTESPSTKWIMYGFLAAFLIKLPAIPLHNWLPDAHTQAPTAGSVILAGLLLKTGAYGLFRFVLPLFPASSVQFAPIGITIGIVGILYGAKLAFAQTDIKRMVAYTSISHMGFVLLGAFAFHPLAMKGAVLQMLTHGISTGALFMIAGALQERLHTRDMNKMGGFWSRAPRMGSITLLFVLASLGLPGLGNFIAEFLILVGTFQVNVVAAIIAALGLITSAIYGLYLMQKIFHGPERPLTSSFRDYDAREMVAAISMVIIIIWLGLFPAPVLKTIEKPVQLEGNKAMVPKNEQIQEYNNLKTTLSSKNNIPINELFNNE